MKITGAHRLLVQKYGTLIGRVCMGMLFLLAGLGKAATLSGTARYIASVGLPAPEVLAYLSAVLEIGAGLMLIMGLRVGRVCAVLICFTALTSWFFHNPSTWDPKNATQQIMFMKNVAIIGGLLYMMAYGPGDAWALGKKEYRPLT